MGVNCPHSTVKFEMTIRLRNSGDLQKYKTIWQAIADIPSNQNPVDIAEY
jgi:hypothetical protein